MAGRRFPRVRLPRGLTLWATLTLLLVLGMATTVMDLIALPAKEMQRADMSGQHLTIDPETGAVTMGNAAHGPDTLDATALETAKPVAPGSASATTAPGDLPAGLPNLRTTPLPSDVPTVARDRESLVMAPAPEVSEITGSQVLPRRSDNYTMPAELYAHRFTRKPGQQLLAFVIIDAGLDAQSMPLLLSLPPEVSIAFSPYTRDSKVPIEALRNAGHEVWTMLPAMSARYPQDDPGPLGLIANMSKDDVTRRLHDTMASVLGSVGFVTSPDEALSTHSDIVAPMMAELNERGLYLLSTHPTHSLKQWTTDKDQAALVRRSDILLDSVANEAVIQSKLAGIIATASAKNETIVVATARPQTLAILKEWFSHAPVASPLTLAPLSAIYQSTEKTPAKADDKAGAPDAAKKPDAPQTDAKPEADAKPQTDAAPDAKH